LGNIHFLEPEVGKALELGDSGRFQGGIVVGVEVVYSDDIVSLHQQALRDVHADETGCAGNENRLPHINLPS
jgi:hypothetical protein